MTPTPTRTIPREEIARVGRKDVGVSGESVSVSSLKQRSGVRPSVRLSVFPIFFSSPHR